MRHAAGQPADGLHLLGVEQLVVQPLALGLGLLARGHVAADAAQPPGTAVRPGHRHTAHLEQHQAAVAVADRHLQGGERQHVEQGTQQALADLLGPLLGQQVEEGTADKGGRRVAGDLLELGAQVGEVAGRIGLPDEVRGGLHQGAVPFLQLPALGDVATHDLDLGQPALVNEDAAVDQLEPADRAGGIVHARLQGDDRVLRREPLQGRFHLGQVLGHDHRLPGPADDGLAADAEQPTEHVVDKGAHAVVRAETQHELGAVGFLVPLVRSGGAQGRGHPFLAGDVEEVAEHAAAPAREAAVVEPAAPGFVEVFEVPGLAGGGAQVFLFHPGGAGQGEHRPQVAAEQVLAAHAEHALRRDVDQHEPPVRVAGEKAVGDVLEHGPEPRGVGVLGKVLAVIVPGGAQVVFPGHADLLLLHEIHLFDRSLAVLRDGVARPSGKGKIEE